MLFKIEGKYLTTSRTDYIRGMNNVNTYYTTEKQRKKRAENNKNKNHGVLDGY